MFYQLFESTFVFFGVVFIGQSLLLERKLVAIGVLAEYSQVINYVRHYSDKRGYSRHFTTKLLTAKWEEKK